MQLQGDSKVELPVEGIVICDEGSSGGATRAALKDRRLNFQIPSRIHEPPDLPYDLSTS